MYSKIKSLDEKRAELIKRLLVKKSEEMKPMTPSEESDIRKRWQAAYDIFQPLLMRKAYLKGQRMEVPEEIESHIQDLKREMKGYMELLGIEQ